MVCSQEERLLLKNTLQMSRKWNECTLSDWLVISGAAYPPAGPRGCVCCADHSGFIRGFAGTQGGVTAGELPVGPLEAGGEVKEGQHQLRGVAVPLPRGIVPLLERPVVGNDLIERYSKHQGRDLCVRDGEKGVHESIHLHWKCATFDIEDILVFSFPQKFSLF